MKKGIIIALICLLSVLTVSCAVVLLLSYTAPYSLMHGVPDIDTVKIEIVNLETEMGYHAGSPYNEESVSVFKVIERDKIEDFLSDFKKIKSYQPIFGSRIDSISGEAIRITYDNGDIELITQHGTATVIDGEIRNRTVTFDSEEFEALLQKYS